MSKPGRNDLCPCGSGKKYKHCCLGKEPRLLATPDLTADEPPSLFPPLGSFRDDFGADDLADDLGALDLTGLEGEEWDASADTPMDRAYDLAEEGWEVTGAERIELAKRALAESADCVDAYNLLASEAATPDEAIALHEQALAAADRVLGPDWWKLNPTRDWTEPLEVECVLEARTGLARALMELGRTDEAIAHLRAVLTFDPEDYGAVRYQLLDSLLEAGRDDDAMELINAYPGTVSSRWPYARALLKYQREGDTLWARRALVDAFAFNAAVAPNLLDAVPPADASPLADLLGRDGDTIDTARHLGPVWQRTPGAIDWLHAIFAAGPEARTDAVPRGDGPVLCRTLSDAVGYIRCPRCERKTKPRKRDIVVMIEPDELVAIRSACHHCENCDTLSILSRDLQKGVESLTRSRGIDLTGRDYVSLGIVDPGVAEARPTGTAEQAWLNEHLLRWSDEISPLPELEQLLGADDLDEENLLDAPDDAGVIDVPFALRPR
ncbi:MAG: hypothetical protein QOG89_2105 [Thermomicrobiales bacterium]|nr:hypothetical protein [Thermomicrobiales bacterium]